jgi:hypothetical protein
MSRIIHPWSVEPTSVNHSYHVVVAGAHARTVAQRLKADAERIVRCVNSASLVQRACVAEEQARDAEATVQRLRAYIEATK